MLFRGRLWVTEAVVCLRLASQGSETLQSGGAISTICYFTHGSNMPPMHMYKLFRGRPRGEADLISVT